MIRKITKSPFDAGKKLIYNINKYPGAPYAGLTILSEGSVNENRFMGTVIKGASYYNVGERDSWSKSHFVPVSD